MSTTFGELKTKVASALRDPDAKTFSEEDVKDFIQMGLVEVGRLAPEQFMEELTLTEDTMDYVLRSGAFNGEVVPEIEVVRVEVWNGDPTPPEQVCVVNPGALEPYNSSDVGYTVWGGSLYLPSWVHRVVDGHEADYVIRVFGYSPYVPPSADGDVMGVSQELVYAIITYAQVEGLQRLVNDRDLFTQWQTRAGNTDISPAGLMNSLNFAREDWRRKSRALTRLRSQG